MRSRVDAVLAVTVAGLALAGCGDDGGSDGDADGSSADAYVGYWAGVIVEHLTDQDDEFVDEIIFHRLSVD